MSQENSDIIGKEWIATSLLEPEYPRLILPVGSIASVDSIDSANLIFQEDSIASVDSIDSENLIFQEDSIALQEIGIDSLTGMAKNSRRGPWPDPNNGSQVTTLKDARLNIYREGGWYSNQWTVTATIKVELSNSESNDGSLRLQSSVWGIDNTIFDWTDDNLFYFPDQHISQSGTYTFTKVVDRNTLDEDRWWFDRRDEIEASISLVSNNRPDPFNLRMTTNIVKGYFGFGESN